jgi:hypothetical protein
MIRAEMSLFIFLFVFSILGLLLAELLSELSKSSSLKSPPDDFEDAASLSSSSSSEDAKTGLFLSSSILVFAPFVLSLVTFALQHFFFVALVGLVLLSSLLTPDSLWRFLLSC